MQKVSENRHMYSCFNKQCLSISSRSLLPNHPSDMFYPSCRLVFSNQPICCIFPNIEKANTLILKLAPKKDALFSYIHTYIHTYTLFMLEFYRVAVELISSRKLIYLFKSFRKYRITHNYAMP